MKRIGVLLAAGQSTRMGRPKQLLPWPPKSPHAKSLVEAAFEAIARVCDTMVVVVGHHADDVVVSLGSRKFQRATGDLGSELFSSVRRGMLAAREIDASADVLLHPADHPKVRLDTLDELVRVAAENPGHAVMPTYRSKGGHPVLIPPAIVAEILAFPGRGGLRQFWIEYPERCRRIPTDDPGVIFDVDTPSDYDLGVQ